MQFYHLVTRQPMYLNQEISFHGNQKNRLYEFFLKNNQTANYNQFINHLSEYSPNSISPQEAIFLKNHLSHSEKGMREIVTEMVRLEHFPYKPSRFNCLYGSTSLASIKAWEDLFHSYNREILQLVILESEGPIFEGNADLLPSPDTSFLEKLTQAENYWSTSSESPLSEVLISIEPNIRVMDIIKTY